jgi:hypothetical protein
VLVAIDDQAVNSGMSPATLNAQINGWVNTPLTLTVRTGSAAARTFTINRTVDPGNYAGRLSTLGINLDFIAGYMIAVDLIVLMTYLVVSYILISHGPGTSQAYFASITLVTLGAAAAPSWSSSFGCGPSCSGSGRRRDRRTRTRPSPSWSTWQ